MPNSRDFNFPVSILIGSAKRLLDALRDPQIGPSVLARLKRKEQPAAFDIVFEGRIDLVENGGTKQSAAKGALGTLTQAQAEAYTEMERLMSSARRTAGLTFPDNDVRLHAEFQVGIREPFGLDAELNRATLILAACRTHADALAEHGWIADDTTLLASTIATLDPHDREQETGKDKKKGITATRNRAANALYKDCLSIQNAARLAYPSTKLGKEEGIEAARSRYLIDEFPPRNGGGGNGGGETPAPEGPAPASPK